MIELFHVNKNFGPSVALQDVSLKIRQGGFVFVTGPSGAGKTTLLRLIFGSETKGLPESIIQMYSQTTYHIPITAKTRSLNLSTAAGIALYESMRNARTFHAW